MEIPTWRLARYLRKLAVERVGIRSNDHGLGKHGKTNAIGVEAHLTNLAAAAGLLLTKIIGRKPEDHQPSFFKATIEPLEAFVLRGVAAQAGRVDHENHLACKTAERHARFILQPRKAMLQKGWAACGAGGPSRWAWLRAGARHGRRAAQPH